MYSAHTKGTTRVPSLVHRGGCATGPYRTPSTLGHSAKSEQLYLIHRNKHREAAKLRRQRNMVQIKEEKEKELNKMKISNLAEAKFKTLVIRMLKELSEDLSGIKIDPVKNKGYTN